MAFGWIELERWRGIGDTNDPLAEFKKPENDRSPNEASATYNNACPSLGVQLHQPIVDLHFSPENKRKGTEKGRLEKNERERS